MWSSILDGVKVLWTVWTFPVQWANTALYLAIGQGPACGCTGQIAQAQGKYKSDSKGQVFYRHQGKVFAKVGKQMFYQVISALLTEHISRLWASVFFNKLIYMYFPNGQVLKKGHWMNITWFCAVNWVNIAMYAMWFDVSRLTTFQWHTLHLHIKL